MRTNSSNVTETAEFNIDKEKYDANFVHIFQKDKCECEECVSKRFCKCTEFIVDSQFIGNAKVKCGNCARVMN